jgi:acylphosphatase
MVTCDVRALENQTVIRRRVVVRGRVQGVFYRDTCQREARRRRVAGWVSNRDDGAVEAIFEGQQDAVEAMVNWARTGPRSAVVVETEVHEEPPEGMVGFQIR